VLTSYAASAPAKKASYCHVVFVNATNERRLPTNFAPPPPTQRQSITSLSQQEASFISWLFDRAELRGCWYRQETLARRLPACLRSVRARNVYEARAILETSPTMIYPAISTLVIGVTSFFRDPAVFSNLRENILPALVQKNRPLRIWSVGCSDGQELYSVTMILADLVLLNQSELLGTDCRVSAVRHAAAGIYGETEIRSVSAEMRQKYFVPNEAGWAIAPPLRTVVRWRSADVLKLMEPGAWDLILCRNFAMYLEPEVSLWLWQKLRRAIRPGGALVVGKAERPAVEGLQPLSPCIFRRGRA
jgi:chemotaxis protein methyltransferase CheR